MLAYSSIAQAGYLLIGVAAVSASWTPTARRGAVLSERVRADQHRGLCCGRIATNATGSELIKDMAGLSRRAPGIAFALLAAMLSLAGVPPLAGFFGKFYIFAAAMGQQLVWLAVLGVLNSIVALYYYLMVVKYVFVDRSEGDEQPMQVAAGAQLWPVGGRGRHYPDPGCVRHAVVHAGGQGRRVLGRRQEAPGIRYPRPASCILHQAADKLAPARCTRCIGAGRE